MNIVLDTHTLSWLLTKDKRISQKARNYFHRAVKVFIPTIVLLELLYLLKKQKRASEFPEILTGLKNEGRLSFISLDLNITEKSLEVYEKLEMHDSIIVTTSNVLNAPLITKDETIQKVYKNTIW